MSSLAGYLRKLAGHGIYAKEDIVSKYEAWLLEGKYMFYVMKGKIGFLTLAFMSM
jgi:hypothetical protein